MDALGVIFGLGMVLYWRWRFRIIFPNVGRTVAGGGCCFIATIPILASHDGLFGVGRPAGLTSCRIMSFHEGGAPCSRSRWGRFRRGAR